MMHKRLLSATTTGRSKWTVGLPLALTVAGTAYYFSTATPKTPVPALQGQFRSFILKEVIPINHNTKTFRFALPQGTTELGLPTASCLVTKFVNGEKPDGKPNVVIRPYTPIEDPSQPTGYFDLVVKRYPTGVMSSHIHSLKVGDSLDMKGPNIKYPYQANTFKEIGMIAGGTGITPMLQVLQRILANPADKTKVNLVFANETEEDILLRDYLDDVAKKHPEQVKVYHCINKPPKGWQQGSGFVNENILKEFMPKPGQGKVFICGPPPMLTAISGSKAPDYSQGQVGGLLKKLGYTEEDVFKF